MIQPPPLFCQGGRDCRRKVYEVGEQVGYRDVAYFSATFKKLVGVSPSEYQDTCQ